MAFDVVKITHVNITVPETVEEATKSFYKNILGLEEIPKPDEQKKHGGAWFRHGALELHLSIEDAASDNAASRRHVCYEVADLGDAEQHLRRAGVEIIPDNHPVEGWLRFYVRDPGGNRLEIAQRNLES